MTAWLFLLGAVATTAPASPPVTFTEQVAPIILASCGPCHRPDGPAPFSLLTYEEVRMRGRLVADVMNRRYMPPWKPDPGHGSFVGDRRLSEHEIALVARWVREGYAFGERSKLPNPPEWTPGWQLGNPDAIVTLPPYALAADGPDRFRTFVVRVPGTGTRYVRGLEFRPGNRAVHHATIRTDPTPASRRLDDADPEAGYEGLIPYSARYPDGHFLGWTPGQTAPLAPHGLAWQLPEGVDLAVHVHLQPTGRPEVIHPAIGLYFTDEAPTRAPSMLRLGRQDIDIAPGLANYVSTDTFDLPVDAQLLAIQPHSHYRARAVRVWAALPDGTRRSLIRISEWDFNWQEQYRYVEPFWLPAGTRLTLEYRFDNAAANPRNPVNPPVRAVWGFRSTDEMGDVWIQMLTRSDADRERLEARVERKMLRDEVVGCELQLQITPDRVSLRNDAAQIYLQLGEPERALAHSTAVVRLQPDSASAHYNRGVALQAAQLRAEAVRAYERAIELDARYTAAHYNLATTLEALGKQSEALLAYQRVLQLDENHSAAHNNLASLLFARSLVDEAVRHYRAAIKSDPLNAEAHANLGTALLSLDLVEAGAHLAESLRIRPGHADAHMKLGRVRVLQGNPAQGVHHFREALRFRPECAPCLIGLAWVLAAHADPAIRQPAESIALAERAVALTDTGDPAALDALAAAYASAGRFDDAVRTADRAADAARSAGEPALASQIFERLQLYRGRRPFVMP